MALLSELFGERVDLGGVGHLDALLADAVESIDRDLARLLLEHGFTGTDRLGRKWVDGKEVAADGPGGGAEKKSGGVDVADLVGKVVDTAVTAARDVASSKVVASLGKAGKWLVDSTVSAFKRLEKRYGRAGAVAIAASSQAISWGAMFAGPALVGVPLYIPSAVAAAPGAAIAEAVKLFAGGGKAKAAEGAYPELSPEDVERLARKLVEVLTARWRSVAGEGA